MFRSVPTPRSSVRRGAPTSALLLALALGLAPAAAGAAAFAAPESAAGEPHRILLDEPAERRALASAFDADVLLAERAAWFEERSRAPLAASTPVRPERRLVLEDPERILRHATPRRSLLGWTLDRGATVVDAWLLLAVPFLLPVVLRRRPRRRSRRGSGRIDRASRGGADRAHVQDPALLGLARHSYPASSLS